MRFAAFILGVGMTEANCTYGTVSQQVAKCGDVTSALRLIGTAYKFDSVTYHMPRIHGSVVDAPFVRTTYKDDWVAHYLLNNLVSIDPVVKFGTEETAPFDWTSIPMSPALEHIAGEARKFNVGMSGFTVPIVDNKNRKAIFSVNSAMSPLEWREHIRITKADIVLLAQDVHKKAVSEAYQGVDAGTRLTPREIECLGWTAKGKTYTEISTIIGISEHTVRAYLKTIRIKMDCVTLAQAVSKATKLGAL